jgi:Skp family chaperone for outer membrane proteins
MSLKHATLTFSLIAMISLAGFMATHASGQAPSPSPSIAVVDIGTVFNSLKESAQLDTNLKNQQEKVTQEFNDRKDKIAKLQNELELQLWAPNSPAFNEKQEQIEKETLDLQSWQNFQGIKLKRERMIQIENLYRKVVDAVGRVAKQNNVNLVLYKEKPVDFRGANPDAITALIQNRKVLWSADELDLTDQVFQLLNNEFTNMTGSTPMTPATPPTAP